MSHCKLGTQRTKADGLIYWNFGMKMNIALIVAGIILIIIGITRISATNSPKTANNLTGATVPTNSTSSTFVPDMTTARIESTDTQPESIAASAASPATDPKTMGNDFENFVANIFVDRNTFSVLEWNQGQTSTEGVYAEQDKNPDFKIKQSFGKKGLTYWVECKFRSRFDRGKILINEYQLNRYRKIQSKSRLKVFMAIGVGNVPSSPTDFYFVPLDSITSEYISREDLSEYTMSSPRTAFAPWVESYFVDKVFANSPKQRKKDK